MKSYTYYTGVSRIDVAEIAPDHPTVRTVITVSRDDRSVTVNTDPLTGRRDKRPAWIEYLREHGEVDYSYDWPELTKELAHTSRTAPSFLTWWRNHVD